MCDASRDVKWAGKCRLACSKFRRIPEPTLGLWTVADFAATLSTYVGTIVFVRFSENADRVVDTTRVPDQAL